MRIAVTLTISILLVVIYHLTTGTTGMGNSHKVRLIAIGDSLTVGKGASYDTSWPVALTNRLESAGITTQPPVIAARSGWTSESIIKHELPVIGNTKADVAIIMIGTNDAIKKVDIEVFKKSFATTLESVIMRNAPANKVFTVTIPDFSEIPNCKIYGGDLTSDDVVRYNNVIIEESERRGVKVIDVTEFTKQMESNPSLLSADGFRPNSNGYSKLAEIIFPEVLKTL